MVDVTLHYKPFDNSATFIHKQCDGIVPADNLQIRYIRDKSEEITEKFQIMILCPKCQEHFILNNRNFKIY